MSNTQLFFSIFDLSHKSILLDNSMIFGAQYVIFLAFLLVILLGLKGKGREKKAIFLITLGIIYAEILIWLIHLVYQEPRPFVAFPINTLVKHGADAAFPSGHTTIMAVIASAYYFYKSKFAPIFFILMLWVGFSRIFIGVHYPFDILGGMFVGLVAVRLAWETKNWFKGKISKL